MFYLKRFNKTPLRCWPSDNLSCCNKYHDQKRPREKRVYFILYFRVHHQETKAETWRQELNERPWRLTVSLQALICTQCRPTRLEITLPTVAWVFLHQLATQKIPPQTCPQFSPVETTEGPSSQDANRDRCDNINSFNTRTTNHSGTSPCFLPLGAPCLPWGSCFQISSELVIALRSQTLCIGSLLQFIYYLKL